jgi:hypothetical protein
MENKKDKFARIAENRTNKILHMIDLLGNCSNKNVYEYSDKDVQKIFKAIENKLSQAKSRFSISSSSNRFKL